MEKLSLHSLFLEQDKSMPFDPDSPWATGKAGGVLGGKVSPTELVKGAEKASKSRTELMSSLDPHTTLEILAIATAFIPVVGLVTSTAIGLADAALYAKEGDNYNAGLMATFSVLPLIGPIITKIPGVKTLGKESMSKLIKKINLKQKLTSFEKKVAEEISMNKDFVINQYNKYVGNLINKGKDKIIKSKFLDNATKQNILKTSEVGGKLTDLGLKIVSGTLKGGGNVVVKTTKALVPPIASVVATEKGYEKLYGIVQSDTPKIVAEKMGYDFNELKSIFGSSGSPEDNLKLKTALLSGWKPEKEIPEKYQTKTYKEMFTNKMIDVDQETQKMIDDIEKELSI
jgi:hypothetical protein